MIFFLLRALSYQIFILKLLFLYELKVRFPKNECGIFHFRFHFVFIEIVCATKTMNLTQNYNNGKSTHAFAPWPLIFKLQLDLLKFKDICVGWGLPKTKLETNFYTKVSLNRNYLRKYTYFFISNQFISTWSSDGKLLSKFQSSTLFLLTNNESCRLNRSGVFPL